METILKNKQVYALVKTLETKGLLQQRDRKSLCEDSVAYKSYIPYSFEKNEVIFDFNNQKFVFVSKNIQGKGYFNIDITAERVMLSGGMIDDLTLSIKDAFSINNDFINKTVKANQSRYVVNIDALNTTINALLVVKQKLANIGIDISVNYDGIFSVIFNNLHDTKDNVTNQFNCLYFLNGESFKNSNKFGGASIFYIAIARKEEDVINNFSLTKKVRTNFVKVGITTSKELDDTDKVDWSSDNEITYLYDKYTYDETEIKIY